MVPNPTVSVIIPTTGRATLAQAIDSVAQQSHSNRELIVVYDGPLEDWLPADGTDLECAKLLATGARRGPGRARNVGLAAATGDLIAFLDDDDYWLPEHLEKCIAHLNQNPAVDIVATSAIVMTGDSRRLSPRSLMKPKHTVMAYLFGWGALVSTQRRMMTPTLVFRAALAQVPMREDFSLREDTWWLLTQEKLGRTASQIDSRSVVIVEDAGRATTQRSVAQALWWADRLDEIEVGAGSRYLTCVAGRYFARQGARHDMATITRAATVRRHADLPGRIVLWAERALCAAVYHLAQLRGRVQ